MENPLQEKDSQWRERPNAAAPVFDPGMATLGTDDEAGGASAPTAGSTTGPSRSMSTTPDKGGGLRLTPKFWYACMAGVILVLLVAAGFSLN